MVKRGKKWLTMVKGDPLPAASSTCSRQAAVVSGQKWSKVVKGSKGSKGVKWSKVVKSGQKGEDLKRHGNGQKWSKHFKSGQSLAHTAKKFQLSTAKSVRSG